MYVYDPGLGVVHGVPEIREPDHEDGYESGTGPSGAVDDAGYERGHCGRASVTTSGPGPGSTKTAMTA